MKTQTAPDLQGYRAIKAEIMRRIRNDTWPGGHLLPAETVLAEEFSCARATVNRAMRELSDEGIIERKRRAGTRVSSSRPRHARFEIPLVRHEVEATGAAYRYALLSSEECSAPEWLRARLNLPLPALLLHVRCMHFADNQPFQHEDRWINTATVPDIRNADFSTISPNAWLINSVPFSEGEISFSAERAGEKVARLMGVQPGEPLFVAERTTWLNGEAITFARMSYRVGHRMTTRF